MERGRFPTNVQWRTTRLFEESYERTKSIAGPTYGLSFPQFLHSYEYDTVQVFLLRTCRQQGLSETNLQHVRRSTHDVQLRQQYYRCEGSEMETEFDVGLGPFEPTARTNLLYGSSISTTTTQPRPRYCESG